MSEKWLNKFRKVSMLIPSVVRACFSAVLIVTVILYTKNITGFASFFNAVVSIIIIYFVLELFFIRYRLDKLERGKNGA